MVLIVVIKSTSHYFSRPVTNKDMMRVWYVRVRMILVEFRIFPNLVGSLSFGDLCKERKDNISTSLEEKISLGPTTRPASPLQPRSHAFTPKRKNGFFSFAVSLNSLFHKISYRSCHVFRLGFSPLWSLQHIDGKSVNVWYIGSGSSMVCYDTPKE